MTDVAGRSLGKIACPLCGHAGAHAKVTANGKSTCITCPPAHDGGCNSQVFGRSPKAIKLTAQKVKEWTDNDLRRALLGGADPDPPPAPPPASADPTPPTPPKRRPAAPKPANPPAPDPTPPKRRGILDFLDREII